MTPKDHTKHKPPYRWNPHAIQTWVCAFARRYHFEEAHSFHIQRIAAALFDALQPLHSLTKKERLYLEAGALLHDIGRTNGGEGHHKVACDIIRKRQWPFFSEEEKTIVALLARYHRGALPHEGHPYFSTLSHRAKTIVKKLAALLRFADGLDRSHLALVKRITCTIRRRDIIISIWARTYSELDREAGLMKSDLFTKVFRRTVAITWHLR